MPDTRDGAAGIGIVVEGRRSACPKPTCALMVQLVKALETKSRAHGDADRAL